MVNLLNVYMSVSRHLFSVPHKKKKKAYINQQPTPQTKQSIIHKKKQMGRGG